MFKCVKDTCSDPILMMVDRSISVFDRVQQPACPYHAELWISQDSYASPNRELGNDLPEGKWLWWFEIGEHEAQTLPLAEVLTIIKAANKKRSATPNSNEQENEGERE